MNNFCTFYIVRHGESEANVNRIFGIDMPLTEKGKTEATIRAKEFLKVKFATAFSSDLMRANQTATIIATEHNLAVTALKILRERNHGEMEGNTYNNLSKKIKKALKMYDLLDYENRLRIKIVPGMESDEEVIGRFTTFLRETALAYLEKTVLVVCHGNMMRTLLVHLSFGTHQELSHGAAQNTGYFVLKSDGVEFDVVKTVGIEKKRG